MPKPGLIKFYVKFSEVLTFLVRFFVKKKMNIYKLATPEI